MSIIDDFLLAGNDEVDTTFGTETMTVDGQSFAVVWNDVRTTQDGVDGGLEDGVQSSCTAQPADVASPKDLLNKRATVDGAEYRILEVVVGPVAVHFTLCDPNEAR